MRYGRGLLGVVLEESPSYKEAGSRITSGYRKIRESATESRPPLVGKGETAV